ncbi:MAG: glycosyltransferase family 4 protein [Planctomycetes bacterium]|nr:glycosyltransferase family 4 protein [Planctomycetota bacterium]
MEIIYPANIRFPMERANSIQVVNTCHALARLGVKTHLLVRRMDGRSDAACLAYYGLEPHPNLILHRLPVLNLHGCEWMWNRSFQFLAVWYILLLGMRRAVAAIFLRETGLARLLIKLRPLLRAEILFEMHTLEHLVKRSYQELMSDAGPLHNREEEAIRAKERFICRNADGIVCISESLRRMVEQELGAPRRCAVIHDAARGTADANVGGDRSGVVYVGQLYPWKGVDVLIRAMKDVDGKLTVVGGLPYEGDRIRLERLAGELGVGGKVTFAGFVPPSEVAGYLTRARVAVLPLPDNVMSRHFTSPLKLFEYMSHGAPIVASDLPTIREVLADGQNAILVRPEAPDALAEGINRLLRNGPLAERLARAAQREAAKYTWEARARKIVEFLSWT